MLGNVENQMQHTNASHFLWEGAYEFKERMREKLIKNWLNVYFSSKIYSNIKKNFINLSLADCLKDCNSESQKI